ncbi:MAG: peptidoglycan bridge formation glycyltransferase FemA/FemB family protein [Eubacteriaceae bacterium]|nr:peptidoglycan bridge formation glycyltransferase FemA/FemB family protein [Eubacteriaceae bacterium]
MGTINGLITEPKTFLQKEHFLQTEHWARFQQSLGRDIVRDSGDGYSWLGIVEKGKFNKRLYVPYGPFLTKEGIFADSLEHIEDEAKKMKLDFIRVEPTGKLGATDTDMFVPGHSDLKEGVMVQPQNTIINDLTCTEDELLMKVSRESRRWYQKSQKRGIQYSTAYNPEDIEYFIEMIHDVALRTSLQPYNDGYYRLMAQQLFSERVAGVHFAELDGKKIASIVFFMTNETMYYAYAGSFTEYRKISPATGLVVYAMLSAKRLGCRSFDFFGCAPKHVMESEGIEHPWKGLTEFKRRFGGDYYDYPGSYELPLHELKWKLYRAVRSMNF